MSQPQADPNAPLFGVAHSVFRPLLTAITWANVATSYVFLSLRLFVRWRRNRHLLRDDFWMVLAWLCLLTMGILQMQQMDALWYVVALRAGRFRPASKEEANAQLEQWLRWSYALTFVFWSGLFAVKASFLNVFFRLVSPIPWLRKVWYGIAAFCLLAYIGGWLAGSLVCDIPSDYFRAEKCNSSKEVFYSRFAIFFATAADVFTDLLIMGLPIAVLPSLQLDFKKKLGLGVAFCLALITIVTAIVRMTQVLKGETVDMVGLSVWSLTELGVAIIVGSLPPLKALLTRSVRKYNGSRTNRNKSYINCRGERGNGYGPNNTSRSVMVAESIPLDDRHRSEQFDGRIYVQKTCEVRVDGVARKTDDEEEAVLTNSFAANGPP
ncbi:hypothetical protein CORC01_03290 [Colletotrichum orchidophilum]|uniref:Rhodopsin domain-containing protein n=1 Tax=Colletotrichum orchidophilum TaxID=1209926 RepID=A0A1G4BJD7_9PEZI|nr:uncharacterized protein CORC01_03290 [Colletotrichum orchidophilum]OHF01534.1 hypothetical protein CORC01_03290 [Colletotrichum orchidophilum]